MNKKPKILIIDDHKIIFTMCKSVLESRGFENLDYAENGEKGLEMDRTNDYDLITCDINMTGMNGVETIRKILENRPEKKIIVISAMGQEIWIKEAMEAGAKDFIIKPFAPEKLIEIVEKHLE